MDQACAIPETIRFDLAPDGGGPAYRIFLRIPPGAAPESGWPSLYLLDANAVIATAVEALRVQAAYPLGTGISDAVVIGIGYPTEAAYDSMRRSWDYGPPPGRSYPPHSEGGPDVRTGGAALFLDFIENRLKPEIRRRAPLAPGRQSLFGHSFGGLFALFALFTRPDAFNDWIAISPAIWWEEHNLLRFAAPPPAMHPAPRVLLGVGEYEQQLAPFQIGQADEEQRRRRQDEAKTMDETRAMAERLERQYHCFTEFAVFEGETHMSVLPLAINLAIRFALGPRRDTGLSATPAP